MHRNDTSNYFLYIEPTLDQKSPDPINDIYTEAVEKFFKTAVSGTAYYHVLRDTGTEFSEGNGWRGIHCNCDGEVSSNQDYLLGNGYITNSLCVHYVRWFRSAIDGENFKKLEILKKLYTGE